MKFLQHFLPKDSGVKDQQNIWRALWRALLRYLDARIPRSSSVVEVRAVTDCVLHMKPRRWLTFSCP
jgi:hypothetical protein